MFTVKKKIQILEGLENSKLAVMYCGKQVPDRITMAEVGMQLADVLQIFVFS